MITWWSRASAGIMSSHQPIEHANPCSSTTFGLSRGPSSRTWMSPSGRSMMRPASAFAGSVSRFITMVFTASRTAQQRPGAPQR